MQTPFCNEILQWPIKVSLIAKAIGATLATIGNGSQLTPTVIADDDG
jgi:hypothetical protein